MHELLSSVQQMTNYKSKIVWCQLIGECVGTEAFQEYKTYILPQLIAMMTNNNKSSELSKVSMLTLARL